MTAKKYRPLLPLVLILASLSSAGWSKEPIVQGVESIGITVTDLDRSIEFYSDVLDFELVDQYEVDGEEFERLLDVFALRLRIAQMRLGEETIELMEFLAPEGRPIPGDSRSNDEWFQHIAIITSDMGRAYDRLRANRVRHASSGPQTLPDWNPNAGGIAAFYFKDPDGNHLEILQFPPDKGEARWQAKDSGLFLGIDHTAIVVSDTEQSLAFYRDLFGLRVAGTSENYGAEQERLNSVFGARLRITALRAASGPGVEFLEYLAPSTGRPMPVDTRANDLWHWQINLRAADVGAAWTSLRESGAAAFVSPGPVDLDDNPLGFDRGLLLRGPDGHASLLLQR